MFKYSFLALICVVGTVICVKLATKSMNYVGITAAAMLSGVFVTIAVVAKQGIGEWKVEGLMLAFLAGIIGTAGTFFETKAMGIGSAAIVKSVIDLAPVLILIIEVLLLNSIDISARQVGGVMLSVVGVMLIVS